MGPCETTVVVDKMILNFENDNFQSPQKRIALSLYTENLKWTWFEEEKNSKKWNVNCWPQWVPRNGPSNHVCTLCPTSPATAALEVENWPKLAQWVFKSKDLNCSTESLWVKWCPYPRMKPWISTDGTLPFLPKVWCSTLPWSLLIYSGQVCFYYLQPKEPKNIQIFESCLKSNCVSYIAIFLNLYLILINNLQVDSQL